MLLLACLVRAGVFAPHAVISAERSNLENSTGFTVLLTLFAACAQVFTLVTPEHGLLHAVFAICFFVQLTTTLAGVKGRRNMLRSLLVLLGSAFVVRFVVLEGLYAQDGGFAKRIVTALIEGASLGAVQYEPTGAGTGYVAFFTLTLFFVGLVLLPPGGPRSWLRPQTIRDLRVPGSIAVLALAIACAGCAESTSATAAEGRSAATAAKARARDEALASARVWAAPTVPVSQFDFASNPENGFEISDEVSCRFVVQKLNGRTQKFHCQLPDGRILKIKYGEQNAELQAEVAGTRLLRALGFSADDMFVVKSGPLRRLSAISVSIAPVQRAIRSRVALFRRSVRRESVSHLHHRSCRAAPRRHGHRIVRRSGMELVRAGSDRSVTRRRDRAPRSMRCACLPSCSRTGTTREQTSG